MATKTKQPIDVQLLFSRKNVVQPRFPRLRALFTAAKTAMTKMPSGLARTCKAVWPLVPLGAASLGLGYGIGLGVGACVFCLGSFITAFAGVFSNKMLRAGIGLGAGFVTLGIIIGTVKAVDVSQLRSQATEEARDRVLAGENVANVTLSEQDNMIRRTVSVTGNASQICRKGKVVILGVNGKTEGYVVLPPGSDGKPQRSEIDYRNYNLETCEIAK